MSAVLCPIPSTLRADWGSLRNEKKGGYGLPSAKRPAILAPLPIEAVGLWGHGGLSRSRQGCPSPMYPSLLLRVAMWDTQLTIRGQLCRKEGGKKSSRFGWHTQTIVPSIVPSLTGEQPSGSSARHATFIHTHLFHVCSNAGGSL